MKTAELGKGDTLTPEEFQQYVSLNTKELELLREPCSHMTSLTERLNTGNEDKRVISIINKEPGSIEAFDTLNFSQKMYIGDRESQGSNGVNHKIIEAPEDYRIDLEKDSTTSSHLARMYGMVESQRQVVQQLEEIISNGSHQHPEDPMSFRPRE